MDLKNILERAKTNSICDEKKEYKKGIKEITKKTLTMLLVTSFSLSLTACGIPKVTIVDKTPNTSIEEVITSKKENYNYKTISPYISGKIYTVKAQLQLANIKYCDEYGKILSNDVETYRSIKNLNEDDLIGYYLVLGEKESNKIINVLGYENWNNYLTEKGFINENGEIDIKMWEEDIYTNMQKKAESSVKK